MIVKNEAHCIERCLDSCKPLIDYVCINDNGSTDNTVEKIISWSAKNDIPCIILNNKWVSFDVNRSLVLEYLYTKDMIDYVLMIDADEVLVFQAGSNIETLKESLTCDLYDVETRLGNTVYVRPQLSSNKKKFNYVGVVHEILNPLEVVKTRERVKGFFNYPIQDSFRNKDPLKFAKDAEALEKALEETKDPFLISRYTFYLAQCYRDGKMPSSALETYLKVPELNGWLEEKYISLLNAGRLMKSPENSFRKNILETFIKAIEYSPTRAEALFEAMVYLREINCFHAAYLLGIEAMKKTRMTDALFLENWIYDYALAFEMSVIAWYANDKELAKKLTEDTISNTKCPQNFKDQAKENLKLYT